MPPSYMYYTRMTKDYDYMGAYRTLLHHFQLGQNPGALKLRCFQTPKNVFRSIFTV
jgi:hypothetical protein